MPSSYPGALDIFTAPGANLGTGGAEHDDLHLELSDGLAAVQQYLGPNPHGTYGNTAARLAAMESAWPVSTAGVVTPARLEQGTIWGPLHNSWNDWTGSASPVGFSTGVGSFDVIYQRVGPTVHVQAKWDFGAGSALNDNVSFLLPITPTWDAVGQVAFLVPDSTPIDVGTCYGKANDLRVFTIIPANTSKLWDATGPLNGGNLVGSRVTLQITYEAATVNAGTLA